MKFYIATGYDNDAEHNRIRDLLVEHGHTITFDWTIPKREGKGNRNELASAEVVGVSSADALIVLLPGARGTHVEIGVALACAVPVLLCTGEVKDTDCVFYDHSNVFKVNRDTLPAVLRLLALKAKPSNFRGA